jgi:hypothetical protein
VCSRATSIPNAETIFVFHRCLESESPTRDGLAVICSVAARNPNIVPRQMAA